MKTGSILALAEEACAREIKKPKVKRRRGKLLETIVDLSYLAGTKRYYSGDSRRDVQELIELARKFERRHKRTDWDQVDYIATIEEYADVKLGI